MKNIKYFVSVIMPVYNGEAYLVEAVKSIHRQNCELLEIIIIDDGSTDNTARIVDSLQGNVRYFYQQNSGPPTARNKGLRMACGDVIAFLDVDDLWSDNKLESQLDYLTKDPSVEIVMGYTQLMRHSAVGGGADKFEQFARPWPAMHLGSSIMRETVFKKVGFFDETQLFGDDADWFLRAKELRISTKIHQEVTLFYRRHKDNITCDRKLDQKYFMMSLKKSLDRRRLIKGESIQSLPQWIIKK